MTDATSRIVVTRPLAMFGRWRRLRVLVDGVERASLRCGDTARLFVAAGPHRVQVAMDWCTSPLLELDCRADGTAELECLHPAWWRAPSLMRREPHRLFGLRVLRGGATA